MLKEWSTPEVNVSEFLWDLIVCLQYQQCSSCMQSKPVLLCPTTILPLMLLKSPNSPHRECHTQTTSAKAKHNIENILKCIAWICENCIGICFLSPVHASIFCCLTKILQNTNVLGTSGPVAVQLNPIHLFLITGNTPVDTWDIQRAVWACRITAYKDHRLNSTYRLYTSCKPKSSHVSCTVHL